MSIATALIALQSDITAARTAITTKGGTVTSGGGSSQLATDIATIPTGGDVDYFRYAKKVSGFFQDCISSSMPETITFHLDRCEDASSFLESVNFNTEEIILSITNRLTTFTKAFFATDNWTTLKAIRFQGDCSGVVRFNDFYRKYGYWDGSLKELTGVDFTSCTNNDYMLTCASNLETVDFVQNSLKVAGSNWIINSSKLTNASIVNIANCLNETVTSKSLALHSTPKAKCSTIMGTVSLDSTQTYHVFTEDASGSTTLADFITNTKGWTLA